MLRKKRRGEKSLITSIYIPDSDLQYLAELSQKTGLSRSTLIHNAISTLTVNKLDALSVMAVRDSVVNDVRMLVDYLVNVDDELNKSIQSIIDLLNRALSNLDDTTARKKLETEQMADIMRESITDIEYEARMDEARKETEYARQRNDSIKSLVTAYYDVNIYHSFGDYVNKVGLEFYESNDKYQYTLNEKDDIISFFESQYKLYRDNGGKEDYNMRMLFV